MLYPRNINKRGHSGVFCEDTDHRERGHLEVFCEDTDHGEMRKDIFKFHKVNGYDLLTDQFSKLRYGRCRHKTLEQRN